MARGDNPNSRKNLKPFSERTEEEQRKIRKEGGKASGKVRREKSTFKKAFMRVLTTEAPEPLKKQLQGLGLDTEDMDLMGAVAGAMANAAIKGNVKAAGLLIKMVGEDPDLELKKAKQKHDIKMDEARIEVQHEEQNKKGLADLIVSAYEENVGGGEDEQ